MSGTPRRFSPWIAFGADLLVLVVFVVAGRRSHDEGSGLEGVLRVWWPFAVALVVGTVVMRAWRDPLAARRVVGTWLLTVTVGMALRIAVQGRDFKASFVVVTALFLGIGMFGWRWVVRRARVRRRAAFKA